MVSFRLIPAKIREVDCQLRDLDFARASSSEEPYDLLAAGGRPSSIHAAS